MPGIHIANKGSSPKRTTKESRRAVREKGSVAGGGTVRYHPGTTHSALAGQATCATGKLDVQVLASVSPIVKRAACQKASPATTKFADDANMVSSSDSEVCWCLSEVY